MKLTWDKKLRQFFLHAPKLPEADKVWADKWELFTRGIFSTYSIPAAARFRRVADEKAEKIFNRVLLRRYPAPSAPLPEFLDEPHQVDGVNWMLTRSRSYLAHAPGAGKTVEAITAAYLSKREGAQCVFIVPPSLVTNWVVHLEKFLALLEPDHWHDIRAIRTGEEMIALSADYLVVPDSMLHKPRVLDAFSILPIKFIAVDEASRFKEAVSARTIALFGGKVSPTLTSPGLIQKAKHAVLLDGSPMPNRPMELWAPVYAMCPEAIDFMSQKQFGLRYCGATLDKFGRWEFKHSSHEDELRQRLTREFMHVVPEGALSHAKRVRSLVFIEDNRTGTQRAWERRWVERVRMTDESIERGEMASVLKEIGMSKVPAAVAYIKEKLEQGEKVLVFAWHREVCIALYNSLNKSLGNFGLIIGGIPEWRRIVAIENFGAREKCALILNIAAGGRGLNGLQSADRIIFVEPSWNDEQNKQCEKRASRRGRDASLPVKSDYLVVSGSLDEAKMRACFTKERRVRKIIA